MVFVVTDRYTTDRALICKYYTHIDVKGGLSVVKAPDSDHSLVSLDRTPTEPSVGNMLINNLCLLMDR